MQIYNISTRTLLRVAGGIACVAGIIWLSFFAVLLTTAQPQDFLTLGIRSARVQVEIANSQIERKRGLSGRTNLKTDHGMLFIHPEEGLYSYWMPDTHISLDILWINTEMRVVHIAEGVTPESYPATFTSIVPARYVLEVPAGFVAEHAIQTGDAVTLR